jgi:hypothetical protein
VKKNLTLFVLLVAVVLLLVAVNNRGAAKHPALKKATLAAKHSDPAPKPEPSATPKALPVSFRPLNFALLRGGFTSSDEFFAHVQADPVLRSFYGTCSEKNAAMKPLAEDVLVFSTFRRGNQIKWARKPLLVRKGEYVLTFCGKTVLARCANLISWTPMQPSEDVPPSLLEIPTEVMTDPVTTVPTTAETHSAPGVLEAAAAPMPSSSSHRFFFVPPIYIPSSSGHSMALPPPVPAVGLEGDEFSGHQALFTLLIGFFVIGLLKLFIR